MPTGEGGGTADRTKHTGTVERGRRWHHPFPAAWRQQQHVQAFLGEEAGGRIRMPIQGCICS